MIFTLGTFDSLVAPKNRFFALYDLLASLPRLTRNSSLRLLAVADNMSQQEIMDGFQRVVTPEKYLPPGVMAYRIAYEQHLREMANDVRFIRLYLMVDPIVDPEIITDLIGVGGLPAGRLDHEIPRPFSSAISRWEYLEGDNGMFFALLRSSFNQYGVSVYPQVLHSLLSVDFPVWVSLQIRTLSSQETTYMLRIKESTIGTKPRNRDDVRESEMAAGTVEQLRSALYSGESLHTATVYVLVGARSLEELNRNIEIARAATPLRLYRYYGASGIIERLFAPSADSPDGDDGTLMTTFGASLLSSSLFSFRRRTRTDGVMLGIDRNQAPVIVDFFSDEASSYNTVVLGQTGSGKTFGTLTLMMRHLLTGTRLVIVDPQGNIRLDFLDPEIYAHGVLGTRQSAINVLDRVYDEIGLQVEFAKTMLRLLGVPADRFVEQAILDDALVDVYDKYGDEPLISDLLGILQQKSRSAPSLREVYDSLEISLKTYVTGSRSQLFGSKTTLDLTLDAAVNVFDISNLPMQGLGGNLRSAFLLVLVAGIQRSIRMRRKMGDRAPIMLFVDEMGILMRDREAASFVSGMFKTARSSLVGMIVADQDLHSLLGPADESGLRHGVPMLANAANVLLFRQKESELGMMREHFPNLPESMVLSLPSLPRGTCVASLYDGDLLVVSIMPSYLEEVVFSSRVQDRQRAQEIIKRLQREVQLSRLS